MNWTTILANAGIPESPGRSEALAAMKVQRAYHVLVRDRKTGRTSLEEVKAKSYHEALKTARQVYSKQTILRLHEACTNP